MASASSSQEEQRGEGIRYCCRLCGVSRSRRSLILSHMQKSHPQALSEFSTVGKDRRIYRCSKCEVTRSSIAKLHKHMRDDHSCALNLPSQRSAIASFSSSSPSSSEEDKKDTNRRYCCRICGASRTKRSLILSHMQKSHPNSLSEFRVVGKDRRIYTCVACGVTRSTISMLRKHMQESHSCALQSCESDSLLLPGTRKRKRFECDECGWLAKKPSLLQQHLHTHSMEKPYSCPEEGCGKCFKLPYHLNRHALQHEEKGCLCPRVGCISVCSNRSNLRRHLQLHDLKPDLKQQGTEESMKRFQCPESDCNLVFRYSCRLQSHCDTAHGEKLICTEQLACNIVG